MAVPTSFNDLSTTPGSNSPAGSENVFPSLDDYIRFINAALASIKANTATNGWVSPYLAGAWETPGTIGGTTPNSGAFTNLSASGTVSGAGFTAYLASPPAIGGTAPNAGTFTTGTFSNALRVTGAVVLGYDTGSGGTVTQATSKSTAVTLNKPTGRITMNAASLSGGVTVYFALNNSLITAVDTVLVHRSNAGSANSYDVWVDGVDTGVATIGVKNLTGGALAEAVILNFIVGKVSVS